MGATGRSGAAVLGRLRGKVPVRAASRREVGDADGITWVRFDLLDPSTFREAFQGVDRAFLLRPPEITSAEPLRPLLGAARDAGVRQVVLLSVKGAEKNRFLPHHAFERLVMESGLSWTMIRPSDFMQNLETVHREAIKFRGEIAVPAGSGRSAFIDVDDVAAVAARILTEPGHDAKGYTLTGPEALSFHDVVRELSAILGHPVNYRPVGALQFLLEQRKRGQGNIALVMTALYTIQRLGLAAGVTREVERLLGRPATPLRSYLERTRSVWAA